MLRIINQLADARVELQRICERTHDEQVVHKEATVREILQTVQRNGDEALLQYTADFDQQHLTVDQLRIRGSEIDAAYQQVSKELIDAIRLACRNIERFHRKRLPVSWVSLKAMWCSASAITRLIRPVFMCQAVGRRIPVRS
jgi:histidinol dehydrogenase